VLKAPRTIRLKLHYDQLLSTFAFRFNSRRYTEGPSFLYHQVRLMVATLRAVGAGELAADQMAALLAARDPAIVPNMAGGYVGVYRGIMRGVWGVYGGCVRGV